MSIPSLHWPVVSTKCPSTSILAWSKNRGGCCAQTLSRNAIGFRSVAGAISRKVLGVEAASDFFYNPMWRAYGQYQHPDAGAATYYRLGRNTQELGWHM